MSYCKKNFLLEISENGEKMKRDPIDQFMKDPDNKARVFMWITYGMIATTFMITIGVILFIIHLLGFF